MNRQRDIILNGLQDLSNAVASGVECWVTFTANSNEHWLQCTANRIRMDWPFSTSPAEDKNLRACFGSGTPLSIDAWEIDSYVTFCPVLKSVDALVAAIDSTFRNLYGLGTDYDLRYEVEGVAQR